MCPKASIFKSFFTKIEGSLLLTSVLAVLLFSFCGHLGCSKGQRSGSKERRGPILLFAVDGLEWRVLLPMVREGKLPVLADLVQRGRYGYLETMEPTLSAAIWTTVATGKIPERHGIDNFVYRIPSSLGKEPLYKYYSSGHRKTKAFWNILSDYEQEVDCIGWWITYPAEEIKGVMVSQTNTLKALKNPQDGMMKGSLMRGVEGQVYPSERQNEVMKILEEVDSTLQDVTLSIFGSFPNQLDSLEKVLWRESLWAFRADETYLRVAQELLSGKEPVDLMAVYLGGPDVVSHRFWRYAFPEEFEYPPPSAQIENFSKVIELEYRYVDKSIGRIVSLADKDPTVIVVSDHGMHAVNNGHEFHAGDPPWLRASAHHLDAPPGVFIAAGPMIIPDRSMQGELESLAPDSLETVGSVVDITPTLLLLSGIPVGRDMYGRALREIVDPKWLEDHPLRYIESHDDAKWLAARKERIRERVDEKERIEQLRSLGYIQ